MFHGLFIDNFCGGGGASTGIRAAIGREVDIAVNHDAMAIAVHKANHPTTEHHCQDIRAVWPSAVTRLQEVAGAWFSPDCKEFSKAKGKPVKNRHIRALANEIVHWLRETRPVCAYIENVEEFEYAAPLDKLGIPLPDQKGKIFKALVRSWRAEGYRVEWRLIRARDHGAPTSRRRLYIIMRRDGLKIVWPKATHGAPDSAAVRAGKLKPYRTAAECIDWSLPCPSIFERTKELVDATKHRVAHGVMRYVVNAARPFIVPITHRQSSVRAHDSAEPLRTITTANGGEFMAADAEIVPLDSAMVLDTSYTNTRASRVFDPADPLRTITSQASHAVAEVKLAPHITKFHSGSVGSPLDREMPTVTGNGNPVRPAGATPLGIVEAAVAPLIDRQFGRSNPAPANQPIGATTAGGGGKSAQVSAFLSRWHSSNTNGGTGQLEQPLGVVTAEGQHHGIVCAHIEQANTGGMLGRAADKPLTTVTTTGAQQRVVETTLLPEGALPPEMMRKANRVAAFLVKYYGTAKSQAVDIPFDTVTTLPRYAVVTVEIDAVTYVIVDIGLRMLTPRELARAQGFPDSYILDPEVEVMVRGKLTRRRLTKAEQIRMIGNSVCPDVARALIAANQPGACQDYDGTVSEMRLAA